MAVSKEAWRAGMHRLVIGYGHEPRCSHASAPVTDRREAASIPLLHGLPAAHEAAAHRRTGQCELAPEMRAVGKQRRDRRMCIAIMPGEGGAYGVIPAFRRFHWCFVLGKRSHVGILLW